MLACGLERPTGTIFRSPGTTGASCQRCVWSSTAGKDRPTSNRPKRFVESLAFYAIVLNLSS